MRMRRPPDPELIGVRFDGMGRAAGQAVAAPVLREQGFARVFGCPDTDTDVVAPPPVPLRRDGVGYLNEDALLAMVAELHARTGAALRAGRFPSSTAPTAPCSWRRFPPSQTWKGRPGCSISTPTRTRRRWRARTAARRPTWRSGSLPAWTANARPPTCRCRCRRSARTPWRCSACGTRPGGASWTSRASGDGSSCGRPTR